MRSLEVTRSPSDHSDHSDLSDHSDHNDQGLNVAMMFFYQQILPLPPLLLSFGRSLTLKSTYTPPPPGAFRLLLGMVGD